MGWRGDGKENIKQVTTEVLTVERIIRVTTANNSIVTGFPSLRCEIKNVTTLGGVVVEVLLP